MTDEERELYQAEPWRHLPDFFPVRGLRSPLSFETNNSVAFDADGNPVGLVWVWIRDRWSFQTFDLEPDAAELLGKALINGADRARKMARDTPPTPPAVSHADES